MIDVYPFYLQKDNEPFRFEIIEGSTHVIIKIPLGPLDELNFEPIIQSLETLKATNKKCCLELKFGLETGFDFSNQVSFSGYLLALEELSKHVIKPYKAFIDGLILYRGTAYFETVFTCSDEEIFDHIDKALENLYSAQVLKRLSGATVLGTILHRLVSFVDDEIPCFAVFEDADQIAMLDRAILFSKERFEHIFLVYSNTEFQGTNIDLGQGCSALGFFSDQSMNEPCSVEVGLLLPQDANLTKEVIARLESAMVSLDMPYRVICEKIFNECWNDIQKVYVAENAIDPMTLRMIKGFEASGGEVIKI